MRLAYSTNGFTEVDLPTAIRRIAEHGYTGVELLADRPHWHPAMDYRDRQEVLHALRRTGLAVSNVNANTAMGLWPEWMPETIFEPSLSNRDPAVRQRRIEYTEAALDFAAAMGATCLSVSSGRTEAAVPPSEGRSWFADSLDDLCERAQDRGLLIGIEYEPGLLIETAAEVRRLIDEVNHPALGANLDIGHAVCAGENPLESIELLAGRIWNVHIEDIRGRKHFHLIPGEGDIDFAAVARALRAVDYPGFVTVELYTCSHRADEAASRAHQHLAQFFHPEVGDTAPGWRTLS
jgi:protein FrlC